MKVNQGTMTLEQDEVGLVLVIASQTSQIVKSKMIAGSYKVWSIVNSWLPTYNMHEP
jgi:hypothetical protein